MDTITPEAIGSRTSAGARAAGGPPARGRRRPADLAPPGRRPVRRVHRRGVGRARLRRLVRPARAFRLPDFADCLAEFVAALGAGRRTSSACPSAGGSRWSSPAPAVPATLVLVGAYAGWAGSLPAEVVEQRLRQYERLADAPPDRLVDEVLPTLFTESAPAEASAELAASISEFHPAGLRRAPRRSPRPTSATSSRASPCRRAAVRRPGRSGAVERGPRPPRRDPGRGSS